MKGVYDAAAVLDAVGGLCKWDAIPPELLAALAEGLPDPPAPRPPRPRAAAAEAGAEPAPGAPEPAPAAPERAELTRDELLIARLQAHLAAGVPLQWRAEAARPVAAGLAPALHARGVSARGGVLFLGGRTSEVAKAVAVEHEEIWSRDVDPRVAAPDCSRVYRAPPPPAPSRAVALAATSRAGGWAAVPAPSQLGCGLHGHSAARHRDTIYVFGGQVDAAAAAYLQPDRDPAVPMLTNRLRAYRLAPGPDQPAVDNDAFQEGDVPAARMLHSAAVDERGGGTMYVFGGVRVRGAAGARSAADRGGWLHALDLATFKWRRLQTRGAWPATTTLLALFFHDGALWAVPDAAPSGGGAYQLHRLDPDSLEWRVARTRGAAPAARAEACAVFDGGRLVVYGGSRPTGAGGARAALLSDAYCLDVDALAWEALAPGGGGGDGGDDGAAGEAAGEAAADAKRRRVGGPADAGAGGGRGGGGALAALAAHAGGAYRRCFVFFGGYRDAETREAVPLLQVLYQGVAPPAGAGAGAGAGCAAAAAAGAGDASFLPAALQHCRQRLARLLSARDRRAVTLLPDGGRPVRMPVLLLALHSPLFDGMFQDALLGGGGGGGGGEDDDDEGPAPVPLPGVPAQALAVAVRWVAGLAALDALTPAQLVDVFRVADRLVLGPLMESALASLVALPIAARSASPLLQLAQSLPGRDDVAALGERAQSALAAQVTPRTAGEVMELAQACGLNDLKTECIRCMYRELSRDVWACAEFACRFHVRPLAARCLQQLQAGCHAERLTRHAPRLSKAAHAHGCKAMLEMLSRDLLSELRAAPSRLAALPQYVLAAEACRLPALWRALVAQYGTPAAWAEIASQRLQLDVLRHKCPSWVAAVERSAAAAQRAQPGAAAAAAGGGGEQPAEAVADGGGPKASQAPAAGGERAPLRQLQVDDWLRGGG